MNRLIPYLVFLTFITLVVGCQNLCKNTDCEDAGYCHEGECICEKWYAGDACEIPFNTTFGGVFEGKANGSSRSIASMTINLLASKEVPNRLQIKEFDVYFDFETDSTLNIEPQTIEIDGRVTVIAGTGSYNLDRIDLEWANFSSLISANYLESVIPTFTFSGERILVVQD